MNFELLKKTGQLFLLDENVEILNGISTMIVNGHTDGQQLIKITDKGETMVFCSDLIPLKSHLQLPWIMGYDLNAVLTLEEKTKFLNEAAKKNGGYGFIMILLQLPSRLEVAKSIMISLMRLREVIRHGG